MHQICIQKTYEAQKLRKPGVLNDRLIEALQA